MKLPSFSSFGFCGFLFLNSVFISANASMHQDDDAWVDPYDMINYDPTTKSMRKPIEVKTEFIPTTKSMRKPIEFNELKKNGTTTSSKPVYFPVFKRFLSKLLKEASKLGLSDDGNPVMHYDAEVKLTKQSLVEINKLLNEENDWTTGAMDEALSQILVRFKTHNHEAWKWRFEDTFYVEADTVLKVSLIVLIVVAVICNELWSVVSWFIQFKRLFAVCFFISLIWNWFHLYMVAFAEHKKDIVEVESFNAKCTGLKELDWMDCLSEWYRRTWTLQDDPCKKYYEVLVVNPILLVPPLKAITVTITSFFTDPLKQFGEGINVFLRALLKNLPIAVQISVLFIFPVFMYGIAQTALKILCLIWRQDPPPPAVGQRQAPQIREHEDVWEGGDVPKPPKMRQDNGNRVNQEGNRANAPQNRQEVRNMEQ